MRKRLTYLIFMLALISCEEVVEWDQQEYFPPRLVVDAMITNQPGYNYVKLSLPVTVSGEEARPVSNAMVSLISGDSIINFLEKAGEPGLFLPENEIRGVVNRIYRLNIVFENISFTAFAGMIPVSPLKAFNYSQSSKNDSLYQILPRDSNGPSMLRYIVEWDNPETNLPEKNIFYHYTLSTIDVNQFFKPAQQTLFFPKNARIIREQYSLSPDHEQYIRSLLSETEWKGGWFDVMPGNLHTNLSRGGVGYFAASSLVVDTVYFE